ncbi:MAG: sigma-70 family RNA polymerase sigma factor [Rhodopirellula sp.]|nr:sigma-70 family RNA polymerase sigma factor [Rhodopirellula sp.]
MDSFDDVPPVDDPEKPEFTADDQPAEIEVSDDSVESIVSSVDAGTSDLLQRAIAGDMEAIGPLLDRFRPLLRARAQESLPAPILARIDESDVVQQTCLLVLRQFEQLRGRSVGEFVAWLLQVHQHNLLNMVEHHRGAAKRDIRREQPGDENAAANIPGQITSPSQKAVRGERRRQLEQSIDTLPEGQRDAVRMRFLEEASLSEIAIRMNRSEEAIAGLLKRGMAQLKRTMK